MNSTLQAIQEENPFHLSPNLKSILAYKELEKTRTQQLAQQMQEVVENPHDRLYYGYKNASQYGLIKKLEEQALGLNDLRSQMLSGEKSNKHTPKKKSTELPAINGSSSGKKKINVNSAIKEKKETLSEFLGKGKDIFMGKMMIDVKREETLRLTEFIINEEETLNEHEADFREHVKFSNAFIHDLTKEAEKTFAASKDKNKEINKEHTKIAQLEQQIRNLESQIKKKEEDKENFETFKKFCLELYESGAKSFKRTPKPSNEDPSKFFLTNQGATDEPEKNKTAAEEAIPKFEFSHSNAKEMADLLKRFDDATIFLIHNTQSKEEELEKTNREIGLQRKEIDKKFNERKESLHHLQRTNDKLHKEIAQSQEKLNRLQQVGKKSQDSHATNDGLDKLKIAQKINSMAERLLIDEKKDKEFVKMTTSEGLVGLMAGLERELETLIKFYEETKTSQENKKLLGEIEREITKDRRLKKAQDKQELDRQKNQSALEKSKQKSVVLRKGRKPMSKIILKQEKETEEVIDEDANKDDDEKYFNDNFVFMDGLKTKY